MIDLDEATKTGNAATQGPWIVKEYIGSQGHDCLSVDGPHLMCASVRRNAGAYADCQFIAYARNHWQEMVDEIRRHRFLRQRCNDLVKAFNQCTKAPDCSHDRKGTLVICAFQLNEAIKESIGLKPEENCKS